LEAKFYDGIADDTRSGDGEVVLEMSVDRDLIDYDEALDDDGQEWRCMTCGGEGIAECDGDCSESDDCGCPYADGHFIRCPNCMGSGKAKDQRYW
jgi:DnaJ-class molecular chaperone